ncbi:uncharacterized protein LOC128672003 [Plodia interpunctella]|uniref:uncharacterized protein LOC128672003 n=1 Tax=Plodia interpunctella TaxID=58824 RepID=UPI0023676582|nr:uncharacterized protein LOC128672003 [Plodia interpunctella]
MWVTLACLLVLVYGGGGVTKTSGISKFWTDDYKVFEQVYGKTSDRDLYGSSLPASVTHSLDSKKKASASASEKKERYIDTQSLTDPDGLISGYTNQYTIPDLAKIQQVDLDGLADRYATQYAKIPEVAKAKPAVSTFNFVSYSDFKPISQQSDPETYNYLKHLEQYGNEQNIGFPKGTSGFKPYLSYVGGNPEDSQAYKSIQDILDAHEGNKGIKKTKNKNKEEDNDDVVNVVNPRRKKPKVRQLVNNYVSTPKCYSGRCRKRSTNTVRTRSRPYIRKVKRIVY